MPGLKPSKVIWHNGELIPWDQATVHVGTHVLHYGSSVFEGIRCYKTEHGSAVFRLREHTRRLVDSARIYRMPLQYDRDQLADACLETIRANEMEYCYIRPLVFRGFHSLGVNPLPCPVESYVMVWQWGSYLGEEALENGVDVKVSSWHRLAPNTMPSQAKAGANYANAALIKMEALREGYAEAIALTTSGYVSEGSGENIFIVRKGKLITPPPADNILEGITRDTVITLARDELGIETVERSIDRSELYVADECFMTGTAAHVSAVIEVDRRPVGSGETGEITRRLQDLFFDAILGKNATYSRWLTAVKPKTHAGVKA